MEVLPRTTLLALREIADGGTMRAAADLLGVTPGAVSQQVSALESRLGLALTERTGRRVRLTDAGQVLLLHSGRILDAQDEALAALESLHAGTAGLVTIGLFGSSASVLPGITSAVRLRFPHVQVRAREIDVDDALTAVRRGVVDMAFGLDYADAPIPRDDLVDITPLLTEEFGIAVDVGDATATATRPIELGELRERHWILPPANSHYGAAMRAACRRAGFEPTVMHEVTDTAASLSLAAAGQGVTPCTDLMRALVPDASIVVVPLRQQVTRSLCLAEPRTAERRPSAVAVASVIRTVVGHDGT